MMIIMIYFFLFYVYVVCFLMRDDLYIFMTFTCYKKNILIYLYKKRTRFWAVACNMSLYHCLFGICFLGYKICLSKNTNL